MGKGYDAKITPGRHGYDAKPTPGKAEHTGQQSHARTGMGVGQHRSGGPGSGLGDDTGQHSHVHNRAAVVGQANGPEANMQVRGTRKDADISTTTHGGPTERFETHPGADDKR